MSDPLCTCGHRASNHDRGYGPHKPKRCNSRPATIAANCGAGVIGAAVGRVASAVLKDRTPSRHDRRRVPAGSQTPQSVSQDA